MESANFDRTSVLVVGDIPSGLSEAFDGINIQQWDGNDSSANFSQYSVILVIDTSSHTFELSRLANVSQAIPIVMFTQQPEHWLAYIGRGIHDIIPAAGDSDVRFLLSKTVKMFAIQSMKKEDQEKRELFISRLIHDLREPLCTISSCTKLSLGDEIDAKSALNTINRSSQYLLKVVDQYLDTAKIKSGHIYLQQKTFSVSTVLDEVQVILDRKLAEKAISLVLHASQEIYQEVLGDGDRLGQVLLNLLSNGIKYSHNHSRIILDISAKNYREKLIFYISVVDEGIGIADDDLEQIFNDFQQAKHISQPAITGTGLGLGIVKTIVEAMGGTIIVSSRLNKGSTFTCKIPFTKTKAEISHKDKGRMLTSNRSMIDTQFSRQLKPKLQQSLIQKPLRMLVADDGEDVKLIMSAYLKDKPIEIHYAKDGQEAIDLSKKERYDLIFLDLHMPHVDGLEAKRKVSRHQRRIYSSSPPVIAMTASVLSKDIDRCYQAGFTAHLGKPFEKGKVWELIERLLNEHS